MNWCRAAVCLLVSHAAGLGGGLWAEEGMRTLVQGPPIADALKGGEGHRYGLRLEAGQFANVVVMQKGVDVVVTAFSPKGVKLEEVDSPNGTQGPESLDLLAKEAGVYTVQVQSLDAKAGPGAYDIRIGQFMTAEEFRKSGIVKVPLPELLACAGVFELAPDHRVITGVLDDLGMQLAFVDTRTGRFGALHAHSATEYFLGATVMAPKPLEATLRFQKGADGKVIGLEIEDAEGKVQKARRIGPGRTEEVSFQSEGLTLRGTLVLPPGKGPFPALVYAHGSGPATRFLGHYPGFFASQGFAVLTFDKRGAGQSQGDWRRASFQALAGDVLAGLAFLKQRAEIDPSRIGLFGISQGGWVGSLAASRSKDVAFFLGIVGSGVPVWENVAHEVASMMKTRGLAGEALEEGHQAALKIFRMAADGATPEALQEAAAPFAGKPWLPALWMVGLPKESPWWTWWKLNGHADPMEILPKVSCPVMWVLGDRDSQVPTAKSESRIRAAFAKGGNKDVTIRVFPKAGHPLMECETGLRDELPTLKRFVPGYLDAVSAWLKAQSKR